MSSPAGAGAEPRLLQAGAQDGEFLYSVVKATMQDHVAATWGSWCEDWQRRRFFGTLHPADWRIVELEGRRAGALLVLEMPGHLFLSGIYLLPPYQGRGVGTRLLEGLKKRALSRGLPLRLEVLLVNAGARRLYERLGWRRVGHTETSHIMEWRPRPDPSLPAPGPETPQRG